MPKLVWKIYDDYVLSVGYVPNKNFFIKWPMSSCPLIWAHCAGGRAKIYAIEAPSLPAAADHDPTLFFITELDINDCAGRCPATLRRNWLASAHTVYVLCASCILHSYHHEKFISKRASITRFFYKQLVMQFQMQTLFVLCNTTIMLQ